MEATFCLSVFLLTLAFSVILAQWELIFEASCENAATTCYEHYTYSPACDPNDGTTPLSLGLVPTVYACAARCQLMKGCRAFLFANETSGGRGACRTYNVTLTPLTSCDDYTYGQLVKANCRPGWTMSCTNDAECTGDFRICQAGRCTCQAGYVFEADSGNCAAECQDYSNAFSVAESTYFDTPVNFTTTSNTKNKCKTECLYRDCRSFQYRPSDHVCVLFNETVATTPGAVIRQEGGCHFYQRECVVNL